MAKIQAPLVKGQRVEITIDDVSHEGEGVGNYEGYVVFVPGSFPGDKVAIKIVAVKKSYARGCILSYLEKSKETVEAPCSAAGLCGGCQLLSLPYEKQLELKRKFVADALSRIGKINVVVNPAIGMDRPEAYRNKVQLPAGSANNQLVLGYYKKGTHDIVPCDGCLQHTGETNELIAGIAEILSKTGIEPYNEKNGKGLLRHVIIRQTHYQKEIMVVLVATDTLPFAVGIAADIAGLSGNIRSIYLNINKSPGNRIMGDKNILLFGKDKIGEKILGLQFNLSPSAFLQVNTLQAEKLYACVLDFAGPLAACEILDLYCGIGTISLLLASKGAKVTGIELNPQAIEDARENAQLNGINNAVFYAMPAEKLSEHQSIAGKSYDTVIINPPRKGCSEILLKNLSDIRPQKIIYVSCNPATLARDLDYLNENGYVPENVQPVDMFPHTVHVESIVLLQRHKC